MGRRVLVVLAGLAAGLVAATGHARTGDAVSGATQQCAVDVLLQADDDMRVGELRQACVNGVPVGDQTGDRAGDDETDESGGSDKPDKPSALARRVEAERVTEFNPFVLTPHRPNFVLPLAYHDSPNQASTRGNGLTERLEVMFQVSFKFPVHQDLFGSGGDLYLAYTGLSFWQAYDADRSRPFRETNHKPEAFLEFAVDWPLLGTRLSMMRVGISHQSNGQNLPDSRSWNRVFASLIWEANDLVVGLRPWIRIPDPPRDSPDDPRGDDNPNIERFAGQFELVAAWRNGNDTYSAMWHNNARADNRGNLTLGWSFPLAGRARGYVRAFTGYAESLIDYDDHHNRISVGILLTDWL